MVNKKIVAVAAVMGIILILSLIAIVVAVGFLGGQNKPAEGNLEIVIYDTQTLYSLPETTIQVYNQQQELIKETTTNEKGTAYLTLPDGTYNIITQRKGYEEQLREYTVQQNSKQLLDIPLTRLNICIENWTCTPWTTCTDGTQTQTCTDNNQCGTTYEKPPETRTCENTECTTNTDCDDKNPCTQDQCQNGQSCTHTQKTNCKDNDQCCPTQCTHVTDNDCEYTGGDTGGGGSGGGGTGGGSGEDPECESDSDCDNGICCDEECVEPECESDTDCEDSNQCHTNFECENPGQCNADCEYQQITECINGDNCCPAGCDSTNDNDCTDTCTDDEGCNDEGDLYCDTDESIIYTCGEADDGDECLDHINPLDCSDGCQCTCGDYIDPEDGNESLVGCNDGIDNDCNGDIDENDTACDDCVPSNEPCGTEACCSGNCDDETNYCFACVECPFGGEYCSGYEPGECEENCGTPTACDDTPGDEHTTLSTCDHGETYFQDECFECQLQDIPICNSIGVCTADPECNLLAPDTDIDGCDGGGQDYFADECGSTCQVEDRDDICRSSGFHATCTASPECNGIQAGTGDCDSSCQYTGGGDCSEEGESCPPACCSGFYCDPDGPHCFECLSGILDSVDHNCESDNCGADSECDELAQGSITSDKDHCCTSACSADDDVNDDACTCSGGKCQQGYCEQGETCYHHVTCSPNGWITTHESCSLAEECSGNAMIVDKVCEEGCQGESVPCEQEMECDGPGNTKECGGDNYYCTYNDGWVWTTEPVKENRFERNCFDGFDNDCDGLADEDDPGCELNNECTTECLGNDDCFSGFCSTETETECSEVYNCSNYQKCQDPEGTEFCESEFGVGYHCICWSKLNPQPPPIE